MGMHSVVNLAALLITAIAFLGASAAWLYDVNVHSPALHHHVWEYVFAAGPYVVLGVFCLVNYFARVNLVFSVFGLIGALFIAGLGFLLWYGNFFGRGNDLGFGLGLLFQLLAAVAIAAMGWIAMLLYKAWQWSKSGARSQAVAHGIAGSVLGALGGQVVLILAGTVPVNLLRGSPDGSIAISLVAMVGGIVFGALGGAQLSRLGEWRPRTLGGAIGGGVGGINFGYWALESPEMAWPLYAGMTALLVVVPSAAIAGALVALVHHLAGAAKGLKEQAS